MFITTIRSCSQNTSPQDFSFPVIAALKRQLSLFAKSHVEQAVELGDLTWTSKAAFFQIVDEVVRVQSEVLGDQLFRMAKNATLTKLEPHFQEFEHQPETQYQTLRPTLSSKGPSGTGPCLRVSSRQISRVRVIDRSTGRVVISHPYTATGSSLRASESTKTEAELPLKQKDLYLAYYQPTVSRTQRFCRQNHIPSAWAEYMEDAALQTLERTSRLYDPDKGIPFEGYHYRSLEFDLNKKASELRHRHGELAEEDIVDEAPTQEAKHAKEELRREMRRLRHHLSDVEQEVVNQYYGFAPYEESHSLKEISQSLEMDWASVRRIHSRALEQLHKLAHGRELRAFLTSELTHRGPYPTLSPRATSSNYSATLGDYHRRPSRFYDFRASAQGKFRQRLRGGSP